MDIHIPKSQEYKTLEFNGTVSQLLTQLNINPETVIVSANEQIVGNDHQLDNKDKIIIHSVISGG